MPSKNRKQRINKITTQFFNNVVKKNEDEVYEKKSNHELFVLDSKGSKSGKKAAQMLILAQQQQGTLTSKNELQLIQRAQKTLKQKKQTPTKPKNVIHDIWNDNPIESNKTQKRRKVVQKNVFHAVPKISEISHPSQSYNPEIEEHQQALAKELNKLMGEKEKHEKFLKNFRKVSNLTKSVIVNDSDSDNELLENGNSTSQTTKKNELTITKKILTPNLQKSSNPQIKAATSDLKKVEMQKYNQEFSIQISNSNSTIDNGDNNDGNNDDNNGGDNNDGDDGKQIVVAKKRKRDETDEEDPTPRKTKTERNKEKKEKIERLIKLKEARTRAINKKLNRINSIINSFSLQYEKQKKKQEKMKKSKLKQKVKHPMTKEKVDVPLLSELSQSLRLIKPKNPLTHQYHRVKFRSGVDTTKK